MMEQRLIDANALRAKCSGRENRGKRKPEGFIGHRKLEVSEDELIEGKALCLPKRLVYVPDCNRVAKRTLFHLPHCKKAVHPLSVVALAVDICERRVSG